MRLRDVTPGTMIKLDEGFTCHGGGMTRVRRDDGGLYFKCEDGKHYLEGQLPFDPADGDELVGISKATLFDRLHGPTVCMILLAAAFASAYWRFGFFEG